MKISYYPDTDSLYLELSATAAVDSDEVSPGVVLDFGADGRLVGIDIDRASHLVDLSQLHAVGVSIRERPIQRGSAG